MAVALWIIELRADSGLVQLVRLLAFKRIKNQIWRRRPPRVMDCFSRRLKNSYFDMIFDLAKILTCDFPAFSSFLAWFGTFCCFDPSLELVNSSGADSRVVWKMRLSRFKRHQNQLWRRRWRRVTDSSRQSTFQNNVDLWSILVSKWTFEAMSFVKTQSFTR